MDVGDVMTVLLNLILIVVVFGGLGLIWFLAVRRLWP
jgi:hypothetical protein